MINIEKLLDQLAEHYGYSELVDDIESGTIEGTLSVYNKKPNPVSKIDFVEDKVYDYLIGLVNTHTVIKVQIEAAKTAPIITKEEVKDPKGEPIKTITK